MAKFFLPPIRLDLDKDQVPDRTLYSSTVAERETGEGFELPPIANTLFPKVTNDAPALACWVLPVAFQVLVNGSKTSAEVSFPPGIVERTKTLPKQLIYNFFINFWATLFYGNYRVSLNSLELFYCSIYFTLVETKLLLTAGGE